MSSYSWTWNGGTSYYGNPPVNRFRVVLDTEAETIRLIWTGFRGYDETLPIPEDFPVEDFIFAQEQADAPAQPRLPYQEEPWVKARMCYLEWAYQTPEGEQYRRAKQVRADRIDSAKAAVRKLTKQIEFSSK